MKSKLLIIIPLFLLFSCHISNIDGKSNDFLVNENLTYKNVCESSTANDNMANKETCEIPLAEEGEECRLDSQCSEGLVCSNFNSNDKFVGTEIAPFAMCIQEWMRNEFKSDEFTQVYAGTSRETTIVVDGLATVAMNALLSVEINMGWYDLSENLTFDIIAGETGYDTHFTMTDVDSSIFKIEKHGRNKILKITDLPIFCPGDDSVDGKWLLRITNSHNRFWVKLTGWGLKLSSRWD